MEYTIKVVKGSTEKVYPCNEYMVTNLPMSGPYRDNPTKIGLPRGQKTKLTLEDGKHTIILLPRDGTHAFVVQNGRTIDTYPLGWGKEKKEKRRQKELRVVEGGEGEETESNIG